MRRAGFVLVALLSGCSLLVTRAPPKDFQPSSSVPECSQSNGAAGVDLLIALFSAGGAIAALDANNESGISDSDKQSNQLAALGLTGLAILSGYSMLTGFSRSYDCREAVRASGFEAYGGNDWLVAPVVLITAGAAAAALKNRTNAASSSGGFSLDPDLCAPGATPTAICRDGVESCSQNRSGTCSHHRGVAQWL